MEKEVKIFTGPEELLEWVVNFVPEFQMSREGAEILLNYMEGHDYRVGLMQDGKMVRVDVSEAQESMEEYSLDDLIDDVSEWNYDLLEQADDERQNASNLIEFSNAQEKYEELLEEEEKLDILFEQTSYGKQLHDLATELAMELIACVGAGEGLERAIGTMADGIRKGTTDKGKSR